MNDIISYNQLTPAERATLAEMQHYIDLTLQTVAASSQRVYAGTYKQWIAWCYDNQMSPFNLHQTQASMFLSSMDISKPTKQRHLTALRKLIAVIADETMNDDAERAHRSLKRMKVGDNAAPSTRKKAPPLEADQVLRLLSLYNESDNRSFRGLVALSLMFATGARRGEVTQMRWDHINWSSETITIPHGKGDKYRVSALLAVYNDVVGILKRWQIRQDGCSDYIVCPMNNVQKLLPGGVTTDTIYALTIRAAQAAGIYFHPHTARSTLITELLSQGVPLHEAQAQAGHSQGSTTLRYATAVNAAQRHKHLKRRYWSAR